MVACHSFQCYLVPLGMLHELRHNCNWETTHVYHIFGPFIPLFLVTGQSVWQVTGFPEEMVIGVFIGSTRHHEPKHLSTRPSLAFWYVTHLFLLLYWFLSEPSRNRSWLAYQTGTSTKTFEQYSDGRMSSYVRAASEAYSPNSHIPIFHSMDLLLYACVFRETLYSSPL